MPEEKSVIVMVWDYFQYDFPQEMKQFIGKVYLSRSYTPISGTIAHARPQLMKEFLTDNGCKVNSKIELPAPWAAAKAGIITFGRNNFAYDDDAGSYIIISTIVIDKKLEYDSPTG